MKKQEYKIEGHIYVPLAELFEGEANEIGHQAHLQTFSKGNETYHVMAVNASGVDGIGTALQKDLDLVQSSLEKSPDDDNLKRQAVVVSNICADFKNHTMRHGLPEGLCAVTQELVQAVIKNKSRAVEEKNIVLISGLTHYDEI